MNITKTALRLCISCKAIVALGGLAFLAGVLIDGFQPGDDLRAVGATILIGSIARMTVTPALRPQIDLYKAGHESGYDEGYHEGRKIARPTIVPMPTEVHQHAINN